MTNEAMTEALAAIEEMFARAEAAVVNGVPEFAPVHALRGVATAVLLLMQAVREMPRR